MPQSYSVIACSPETQANTEKRVASVQHWCEGGWKTDGTQSEAFIEIKLAQPCPVSNICIVNSGSASVEILSRKEDSPTDTLVLLPETPLMTPEEVLKFKNTNRLIICNRERPPLLLGATDHKHSILRFVCKASYERAPSKPLHPFGLTYIGINLDAEDIKELRKIHRDSLSHKHHDEHKHEEPEAIEPAEHVLEGLVIVTSAIPTSERNHLRKLATALGARFKRDWSDDVTHLICASAGTPKYHQALHKAYIVNKQWLLDSYKYKKKMPEFLYHVVSDSAEYDSGYVSDEDEAQA